LSYGSLENIGLIIKLITLLFLSVLAPKGWIEKLLFPSPAALDFMRGASEEFGGSAAEGRTCL